MLLVCFCQANIAPLVFYACVQFNVFSSSNYIVKGNLFGTVIVLGFMMGYAFLFYPFMFRYGSKVSKEKVSDFSFKHVRTCWLEMGLKCLRSFFQALIHGLFINRNILQLFGLAFLDIAFICFVVTFRKNFIYYINYVLILLFFMFFTAFDLTLLVFTIDYFQYGNLPDLVQVTYNFTLMLIVVILIGITVIRMLLNIGIIFYEFCKSKQSVNKVQDIVIL